MQKYRILNLLLISIVSTISISAESYYDSNTEYNQKPKSIPAKQVIIQNRKTISKLERKVEELETRVSGMVSLIEGINTSIAELKVNGAGVNSSSISSSGSGDNTELIKELGAMIDKINNSYVTKSELNKALGKKSSKPKVTFTKNSTVKKEETKNDSFSTTYSEGVRLYTKKRYDESEKRFILTDRKGYKPAASNYYLGEISYYTKKYEDAIFYYKKSASLYGKAEYIDVLLLHTAISLEKTGDKDEAKIFYNNIINSYPSKKSASIAKSKLRNL